MRQAANIERWFNMNNAVKLQGICERKEGTKAKDLKVGDVCVWNYGEKSQVTEIIPSKTGKTATYMMKSLSDGQIRNRKMGANTLVVVERKGLTNEVEKAIINRKTTHHGIYSDVGCALDGFSTQELVNYFVDILGYENLLRDYIEHEIIASEISKAKAI
jgi:PP-loop superfamily ATP-utilizing enzyme